MNKNNTIPYSSSLVQDLKREKTFPNGMEVRKSRLMAKQNELLTFHLKHTLTGKLQREFQLYQQR